MISHDFKLTLKISSNELVLTLRKRVYKIMVSKNNQQWKRQQEAQRVPHYGLRKLSVGVASVLLSTTLYMGVTAHADTIAETSQQPTAVQPTGTGGGYINW